MTINPEVLFEDNHLLIVNKPAGYLVQGDKTGDVPLVEECKSYLKRKYDKPGNVFLGVVHRLDRPVSGVLVFARTSKALERMNRQFQEREVQKIYWAIVGKRPPAEKGTLEHYLLKDTSRNIVKAFEKQKDKSQKAILHYQMLKESGGFSLLQINPVTGRPHQIRVQLSKMGCPIKGDLKYGYKQADEDGNISLHARRITFSHPTTKERMTVEASIPAERPWERAFRR